MTLSASAPSVRVWYLVPAAGVGSRMQADRPKQYLELSPECCVLEATLATLKRALPDAGLCLVLGADDGYFSPSMVPWQDWLRADGGTERANSVLSGLECLSQIANDDDLILVHDVARPCVREDDIRTLVAAAQQAEDGAILAAPASDTMKRAAASSSSDSPQISHTESRVGLWHALTPQAFRLGLLRTALRDALASNPLLITDEASALEACGRAPMLVVGARDNLKITHPEDLAMACLLLAAREVLADRSRTPA
ncbi:2-C-methyl-D-erythritol 4-phosphate cytidylyltransferase [Cobetia sp. L2A1]|uniref:2-C-methyl-D-erythritol 4-phosphate cytidylyltransferase n=1 Tax=Cobetia sp. L2A1 TaxID=2686360 RepID=UPI00131BCEC9|nr:2-C-methyl-D-erythritol 4-phosphate cytidylyltransferase [Cobetia sp. L2A1]